MIFDSEKYKSLEYVRQLSGDTCLLSDAGGTLFIQKAYPVQFAQTAEKLCTVKSDRLARALYFEQGSEHVYVIFEYTQGRCLSDILGEKGKLPARTARRVAGDVCDALTALHSAGLVHRDVNPNNVIIKEDGSAVLIDLGIVREVKDKSKSDTVILGTPGYAAPEQFGFTQSDARTDIYALGVLINVMYTGTLPSQVLASGRPGEIVKKCTAIDARERFVSASDVKYFLFHERRIGGRLDGMLSAVPGFRAGKGWHIVLAIILYLFAALVIYASYTTFDQHILLTLGWIFFPVVPYIFIFNIFDVWERFPLTRGCSKSTKHTVFYIAAAISCYIGLRLLGIVK